MSGSKSRALVAGLALFGDGQVTSSIQTCREAYTTLSTQWNGMVDDLGKLFGRQLYPKQTADLAKAKLFAEAKRFESRWSSSEGSGVQGSLNTSDAFLNFARSEITRTPMVYQSFDPANATHWATSDPQISRERQLLVSRYMGTVSQAMRADVENHLSAPTPSGLAHPSAGAGVQLPAAHMMPSSIATSSIRRGSDSISNEVIERQLEGQQPIHARTRNLDADTRGAGVRSREGLKAARLRADRMSDH